MEKYEYVVHYHTKHNSTSVYNAVCEKLKTHLWQIRPVDDTTFELRSGVEGYYLSPKPAHRTTSSVKSIASAANGQYGPIYIVLREREDGDALTIVGVKHHVLQAAFVLRG
jgi:hypothetical protein